MQSSDLKSHLLEHWKIVICSIAFLCYVQTLAFSFVYDDKFLIVGNPYITSFRHLPQFFTSHLWDGLENHMVNYYRPLLLTWSLMNYLVFGVNPIGWHLTNVLLHVLATYLVCVLAENLTADRSIGIFTGLIFAVHPIHLEVVAWTSAASDMLLTIFVVGSLVCYIAAGECQNRRYWLTLSSLLYIGALLSKEPAVMMPALIFSLAWLKQNTEETFLKKTLASLKATAPFLLIACGYYTFRLLLFGGEHYNSAETLTTATMVRTWPLLLCFYLKLLILPFHLSPFYDVPSVTSVTQMTFLLPVLLIVVLAAGLLFWSRRDHSRVVLFASLWLIWLLPAFYLRAFSPEKKVGDRYLYLPSVGFCLLAGAAIRRIRIGDHEVLGVRASQGATALVLAGALTAGVFSQEIYWSSDLLLFYRALSVAPKNDMAREDLAAALMGQQHYAQAIPLLVDVVQRKPARWSVLSYLGISYYYVGNYQDSVEYLSRAVAADPRDAQQYGYLGLSFLKLNQLRPATENFDTALRLNPEILECHFGLGFVFERQGKLPEALRQYEAELKLQPSNTVLQKYVKEVQARLDSQSAMKQGGGTQQAPAKL